MPSSATITSISATTTGWSEFTSTSGTIRSARVMNNFNFMRGHFLPFDPNTIAGADLTYDLGSAGYRWRNIYGRVAPTSTVTTGAASLTTTTHDIVLFNLSATATASLPSHVGITNTVFTLKHIGTVTATLVIDPDGTETIDNTTTIQLVSGEAKRIIANNGWYS